MAKLGTSSGQGFAAFAGCEPSVKAERRTNAATMEPNVISAGLVRPRTIFDRNALTRLKVYRVMAHRQGTPHHQSAICASWHCSWIFGPNGAERNSSRRCNLRVAQNELCGPARAELV